MSGVGSSVGGTPPTALEAGAEARPAPPASPADAEAVAALTREAGTSFYRGMRVLPPARRTAMYGIYAFCRAVDDIADAERPLTAKRADLDLWRRRVAALYLGQADDPVTRVLREAVATYGLAQADFGSVIDGMEMDAGAPIVAPELQFLDLYCDRVASAVGRLSIRIFGETRPIGLDIAHHLGRALQLTNILRDVGEDATRGRLYLPAEALDAAGVPHDPASALRDPALPKAMAIVAEQAETHFAAADAAMRPCPPQAIRPARMMASAYRPLLAQMRRRRFAHPERRPSLPLWRKLLLAADLAIHADRG